MTMTTTTTNRNFDGEALLSASEALKTHDTWAVFTHAKSDGDALGSASALFSAGVNLGKNISWFSPDVKLPEAYNYLVHFGDVKTCGEFTFSDDGTLYVFLDCSNEKRTVSGYNAEMNLASLNIDHHVDNTYYARVNCVDGSASSTCEMLYRVFRAGKWNITPSIAESLYTGIFTDTGGFSFSNTLPETHRTAAELISLGVDPAVMSDRIRQNKTHADFQVWSRALSRVKILADGLFAVTMIYADDFTETGADISGTEGLSQMLMTLRGVKLTAAATEYSDGTVRLSVRSREGSPFGAGEFARMFGGGGHERAAGSTFDYPASTALKELEAAILTKYHEFCNPHQ